MQDMMLQLNLPGKTIQQGQTSKSYANSGKASSEDHFRNMLENSSKSSKEISEKNDSVGKTNTQKTDKGDANTQQPVKTQGNTEEKPITDGTDETVKEDALWKAEAQAIQFLMLGNNQMENVQVISGLDGTEVQPEIVNPLQMDVQALTEEAVPETAEMLLTNDGIYDSAEEKTPVSQTWADQMQGETTGAAEIPVETAAETPVKTETVQKVSAQTEPKVQTVGKNGGETIQQTAVSHIAGQQTGESAQRELGAKQSEQSEESNIQPYFAQTIQQPDTFQNQIQGASGIEQPIYVQANNPQELMDQLLEQLKAKATLGNQEFEIHLQPENLGKLAIKVAYTLEKVSISIVCTNERTMELLSSGAKNIAQIMEETLGSPTTLIVDQEESNYLEQYNNQGNSRQQQEQEQKEKQDTKDNHQDFLQQLRLGLI